MLYDMDQILPVILQDTYTLSQLKHKLSDLKSHLLENFFGTPDQTWLKSVPLKILQAFNKDNVYEIFTSLEIQISKLPTLTVYLTFEADDQALAQIGQFTRKTLNPALLLDIKYDPNLIAGAALVWKGVYKDYSLRSRIEEKKGEILEGFKKYLR